LYMSSKRSKLQIILMYFTSGEVNFLEKHPTPKELMRL
jgi:hypothetical protein